MSIFHKTREHSPLAPEGNGHGLTIWSSGYGSEELQPADQVSTEAMHGATPAHKAAVLHAFNLELRKKAREGITSPRNRRSVRIG